MVANATAEPKLGTVFFNAGTPHTLLPLSLQYRILMLHMYMLQAVRVAQAWSSSTPPAQIFCASPAATTTWLAGTRAALDFLRQ